MPKCQEKIFPGFKENHENLKRVNDLVSISDNIKIEQDRTQNDEW